MAGSLKADLESCKSCFIFLAFLPQGETSEQLTIVRKIVVTDSKSTKKDTSSDDDGTTIYGLFFWLYH